LNILLGVSGSIAAYKAAHLTRLLVKNEHNVKIILTESAKDFITPLTLSTLSKNPVYSDFFNKNDGTWINHVELGEWADILLIAPASANTIASMANGFCNNLLLACYLSATCPVYFAPAMDRDMYKHFTVQKNLQILADNGIIIIPPGEGELASGLHGLGRMAEPEEIAIIIKA
jgi:phosphopantothenoylcysteine decarboxylase/phosphopantothenate--cysteine ligase